MKGKVKFFDESKGYGFISGEDGTDYYVHLTGLKPGVRIKDEDEVSFKIVQGDKGPKAEEVELAKKKSSESEENVEVKE